MNQVSPTEGFWKFTTAHNVHFGRGCVSALTTVFADVDCSRVMIVTDDNIVSAKLVSRVADSLFNSNLNVEVFAQSQSEPTVETVLKALTHARMCRADAIVGLGGGSNIDVAKLTGMLLKHRGLPQKFFGFDRVPGPITPVVAMPTTAGTGSEVSHSAVVTDTENQIKVSTLSRWLRPYAAIVDPSLTDTCPSDVTAHSGIDALTHAVEAFLSRSHANMDNVDFETRAYEGANPLCDLFAGQAIQLIGKSLVDCVNNPTEASRDNMALAALLGGMAFSNAGVGLVHALEYPIGGHLKCPHGAGTGLLLPHVMRYLIPHRSDRIVQIGKWLGMEVPPGATDDDLTVASIRCVESLLSKINVKTKLTDFGADQDQLPHYARQSAEIKRLIGLSPGKPTTDDLEQILRAAY